MLLFNVMFRETYVSNVKPIMFMAAWTIKGQSEAKIPETLQHYPWLLDIITFNKKTRRIVICNWPISSPVFVETKLEYEGSDIQWQ